MSELVELADKVERKAISHVYMALEYGTDGSRRMAAEWFQIAAGLRARAAALSTGSKGGNE